MSHILTLCMVTLLAACASAGKPVVVAAPAAVCADCPEENEIVTVVENNISPRFFVLGQVNGQPEKFFLDTGAARSTLLADNLTRGIPPGGQYQFSGTNLKPRTCDWIKVNKFVIAGRQFSKTPFVRCEPVAGDVPSLGLDYLDHQIVSLDFDHAKIGFKKDLPGLLKTVEMKRGAERHIEIPVRLADRTEWAIFDTGCAVSMVDQTIVDASPGSYKAVTMEIEGETKPVTADIPDATGNMIHANLYVVDNLEVGSVQLHQQLIAAAKFSKDFKDKMGRSVVLGANSIVSANWVLDLKNDLFAVTPRAPENSSPVHMEVSADETSRLEGKLVLRGNAKLLQGSHTLTGNQITFIATAKTAECTGECVYNDGGGRTIRDNTMTFLITEKAWKRQFN